MNERQMTCARQAARWTNAERESERDLFALLDAKGGPVVYKLRARFSSRADNRVRRRADLVSATIVSLAARFIQFAAE